MTIFTPRPQWIVDLINELAGPGAGGVWGAITGTLSSQTDLQAALDAKVDDSQISAFGATLIDDADAAAARTTLGLGTAATSASSAFAAASHTHVISDVTNLQTSLDNKLDDSQLDTDTTLAANSDTKIATQKAVKAYADAIPAWVLISSWTYSTNVTEVDFANLGSYSELLIVTNDITKSVSGETALRVSTDNGSSFFSGASDYQTIAAAGTTALGQFLGLHGTPATAARTTVTQILASNVSGQNKVVVRLNRTDGIACRFVGSTSAINAVRIFPGSGGNITGGNIQLFGKR